MVKKSNTFWDRMSKDYNKNKPICGIEQLKRSLKTKLRGKGGSYNMMLPSIVGVISM